MGQPVQRYTEDTIARLAADVRAMEAKYGVCSSAMLDSVREQPSNASREVSTWLTSYLVLKSLRRAPGAGTTTRTTA
jgi:hypothetical protein